MPEDHSGRSMREAVARAATAQSWRRPILLWKPEGRGTYVEAKLRGVAYFLAVPMPGSTVDAGSLAERCGSGCRGKSPRRRRGFPRAASSEGGRPTLGGASVPAAWPRDGEAGGAGFYVA